MPGDYDGDGRTDLAVYRSANATFTVQGHEPVVVGEPDSFPAPADYDGDGKDDLATMFWGSITPSIGAGFFIRGRPPVSLEGTSPSEPGDFPAPANYDGAPGDDVAASIGANGGPQQLVFANKPAVVFRTRSLSLPATVRPYVVVNILRLTALYKRDHSSYQPTTECPKR